MKTGFISTAALTDATRIALSRAQIRLADAQKELSTGRHADVGRALGATTARTISLRQEHARLQAISDTNGLVSSRIGASQAALDSMAGLAEQFIDSMLATRNGRQNTELAVTSARDALASFAGLANAQWNGEYLFAGANTDLKPVADYFDTPASNGKAAVDAAVLAQFGVPQGDPLLGSESGASLQTFLDGPFSALFDSAAWKANWSTAADQNVRSRISTREVVDTSTSANVAAFRGLAAAFTMVADLGLEGLGEDARKTVIDSAIRTAGDALVSLTGERAVLGQVEERTARSRERISIQLGLIEKHVGQLESVDTAEAAMRVSALTLELETSYALTGRIQQLSLLNYL